MKLLNIPYNQIKTDGNPRKTFKGIEELAENIKQVGITTPLIVDPNYKLLDGERRLKASKGILDELPCVIIDRKDWDKPDKRLEIQISIDAMRQNWNVMERAKAWKSYLDMGHSERSLAKLLGLKSHTSIKDVIGLLGVRTPIRIYLEKNDLNWSWFSDTQRTSLPQGQKDIIHQRIIDGAYEDREDLRDSLKIAVDNPELVEKMAKAVSPAERQMVEFGATHKPERVERKFMPKKRTAEEEQADIDKRIVSGLINALNQINMARVMWERTDAIDLIKKYLKKKDKDQIIKSIETIVRVWSKTLKELKK